MPFSEQSACWVADIHWHHSPAAELALAFVPIDPANAGLGYIDDCHDIDLQETLPNATLMPSII